MTEGAPEPVDIGAAIVRTANAALRLAAGAAQSTAEALSGRSQPTPAGESPFASLVRHSSAAFGAMVSIAVSSGRSAQANAAGAATSPAAEPASAEPAVTPGLRLPPGGTARIPLSIDNPGTAPMERLSPTLTGATLEGAPCAPAFAVSFFPETLTVAPRDFEKLVVTLALEPTIAAGRWTVLFALDGDGAALHELPFQVAEAGDP